MPAHQFTDNYHIPKTCWFCKNPTYGYMTMVDKYLKGICEKCFENTKSDLKKKKSARNVKQSTIKEDTRNAFDLAFMEAISQADFIDDICICSTHETFTKQFSLNKPESDNCLESPKNTSNASDTIGEVPSCNTGNVSISYQPGFYAETFSNRSHNTLNEQASYDQSNLLENFSRDTREVLYFENIMSSANENAVYNELVTFDEMSMYGTNETFTEQSVFYQSNSDEISESYNEEMPSEGAIGSYNQNAGTDNLFGDISAETFTDLHYTPQEFNLEANKIYSPGNKFKVANKNERKFICYLCNKHFDDRSGLKKHISSYNSGTCYKCHKCGHPYRLLSGLFTHMRDKHK